jgi:hypothetical protein
VSRHDANYLTCVAGKAGKGPLTEKCPQRVILPIPLHGSVPADGATVSSFRKSESHEECGDFAPRCARLLTKRANASRSGGRLP